MNIRDKGMWPEEEVPENTPLAWRQLLVIRHTTTIMFMKIEEESGGFSSQIIPTKFDTSKGQDLYRLYAFRVIEEIVEAIDSHEEDHQREELIDALNFLWSIISIDAGEAVPTDALVKAFFPHLNFNLVPQQTPLYEITTSLGRMGDSLRNRSWMHNAQDTYFEGAEDLLRTIAKCTLLITTHFPDWETFWRFYIAKDNVLQFRLRSNY